MGPHMRELVGKVDTSRLTSDEAARFAEIVTTLAPAERDFPAGWTGYRKDVLDRMTRIRVANAIRLAVFWFAIVIGAVLTAIPGLFLFGIPLIVLALIVSPIVKRRLVWRAWILQSAAMSGYLAPFHEVLGGPSLNGGDAHGRCAEVEAMSIGQMEEQERDALYSRRARERAENPSRAEVEYRGARRTLPAGAPPWLEDPRAQAQLERLLF